MYIILGVVCSVSDSRQIRISINYYRFHIDYAVVMFSEVYYVTDTDQGKLFLGYI